MLKLGMTDSDLCKKCRQRETLDHLLVECWYPAIIWSNIHSLYVKTDLRNLNYERQSLSFAVGAKLSHPKTKLHLEIIKKLTNKDRPSILPKTLIRHSLDYLIMCDKDHRGYYKRLKEAL